MAQKLALMGAVGRVEGPWITSKGSEERVVIAKVYEGCDLQLELVRPDLQSESAKLTDESTPFPHPAVRYRILKQDNLQIPTTVTIHFK